MSQQEQIGLEALSNKTLVSIIDYEVDNYGGLKSLEAQSAFQELCRRSGHDWALHA